MNKTDIRIARMWMNHHRHWYDIYCHLAATSNHSETRRRRLGKAHKELREMVRFAEKLTRHYYPNGLPR